MAENDFTGHVTLAICVRDFDAAVAWYADILGSKVVYEPVVEVGGRFSSGRVRMSRGVGRWLPRRPPGVLRRCRPV